MVLTRLVTVALSCSALMLSACSQQPLPRINQYVGGPNESASSSASAQPVAISGPITAGLVFINDTTAAGPATVLSDKAKAFLTQQVRDRVEGATPIHVDRVLTAGNSSQAQGPESLAKLAREQGLPYLLVAVFSSAESEVPTYLPLTGDLEQGGSRPGVPGFEAVNYALAELALVDARNGDVLVRKNPNAVLPIASITKLMTAMVVLDAGLPLGERLQITRDDIDRLRGTSSRLHPGATLTRAEMLQLALMASENRAANALGRHYPGGMPAFVAAMNAKARTLGLRDTRFTEPTGLSSANVSTGGDLAQLARAASAYPLIRQYSTARSLTVQPAREPLGFYNTNRLVSTAGWSIGMQKTGFISEAGNCLVMIAQVDGRQLIFVLLDAAGKLARFGDAQRIRGWVEKAGPPPQRIHAESTVGDAVPLRVSHNDR